MDDEKPARNLDDWALDDDGVDEFHVAEMSSFDGGHTTLDKTMEYLELSEDESVEKEDLGGINTIGLSDDEGIQPVPGRISTSPHLDINPWDGLPYSSHYYDLLQIRKKLIVWEAKDDFILGLDESSVVLVTGRAGAGKSTQIPQWCAHYAKELGFQYGTVVCTQPYSLAAASLALQVSREMDLTTTIGNEVGYKIPFSDVTSEETKLKFCTDHVLLREMADDPYLERYGIVIVDEAQERTVYSDILVSLLRVVASRRNTIKVVVISLPNEMPKLEDYFEGVPVVDLSYVEENGNDKTKPQTGNLSPSLNAERKSKLHFKRTNELHCDYVTDAVDTVLKCHCDQFVDGNILVFMPGEKDIYEVCERVARAAAIRALRGEAGDLVAVPLFSMMPYGTQQTAYEASTSSAASSENGLCCRKVIVCDRMLESSFSTENVAFVVDSGREISKAYDCRTRSRSHILRYTTKLSANLRYMRCKNEGHVYRLYSKTDYQKFDEIMPPALSRNELSTDVLLMKRLLQQLDERFSTCQTIDPPAPDAYMQALEDLDYHGALDESGDLSDLGAVMSEFPVSLPLAKSLIASCGEQCTEEMLTIASMLVAPSCFLRDNDTSSSISSSRRKLNHPAGDHFTLLHIYEAFIASSQSEYWCKENGLRYEDLKFACKVRDELAAVMHRLELPTSQKIMNEDILTTSVKKALLAGFFMQVAKDVDGSGNYLIARDRHVSRLRKSTSLVGYPDWVLYHEFILSDTNSIVTVAAVTAEMIAEISPSSYIANLPPGEAKDILTKAASKLKSQTVTDSVSTRSEEPETSNMNSNTNNNKSLNKTTPPFVKETVSDTNANSPGTLVNHDKQRLKIASSDRQRTQHNQQNLKDADYSSSTSATSDPVSDLISATASQFTNAYQQASDYVRNYAIAEENEQDACNLQ